MKLLLFKGDNCPECNKLMRKISKLYRGKPAELESGVAIHIDHNRHTNLSVLDTGTVDGLAESAFWGVKAIPAMVVVNEDGDACDYLYGTEDIIKYLEKA